MASQKCMDVRMSGVHLECVKNSRYTTGSVYRLYVRNMDHKIMLLKCDYFLKVVKFIEDFFRAGMNNVQLIAMKECAKKWGEVNEQG